MTKEPLFIPDEIMRLITEFLGFNYWKHRDELTHINFYLDFITSDYFNNAFWFWQKWRSKRNNSHGIQLMKPLLPNRFLKHKNNIDIIQEKEPIFRQCIKITKKRLRERHKTLRVLVHF